MMCNVNVVPEGILINTVCNVNVAPGGILINTVCNVNAVPAVYIVNAILGGISFDRRRHHISYFLH